jgi:hypothetical protein
LCSETVRKRTLGALASMRADRRRLDQRERGGCRAVRDGRLGTGQNSGGPTAPDCLGTWSIDMNAFAQSTTTPLPDPALRVAGTFVNCPWWGRDPGYSPPNDAQLSNALEYCVGP